MVNAKTLTSVVIIVQVFFCLAFILNSAWIMLTIITRMVDSVVTGVLAAIGTWIVGVATI